MATITQTELRPQANTLNLSQLWAGDKARVDAAVAAYTADRGADDFEAQVTKLEGRLRRGEWAVVPALCGIGGGVAFLVDEEGAELARLDWRIGRLGDVLCVATQRNAALPTGCTEAVIGECLDRRAAAKREAKN